MVTKRFQAQLGARGNDGLLEVPFDVEATFGSKRAPVVAKVRGVSWRTTVAVYGGRYYIGMRKELRDQAGVEPGQKVSVTLESDETPRTVEVPPDLARALKAERHAKRVFDGLSFTHQNEYVRWITEAKKQETRDRRLEKAIQMLLSGTKHP